MGGGGRNETGMVWEEKHYPIAGRKSFMAHKRNDYEEDERKGT